jgi:hypothetical protein
MRPNVSAAERRRLPVRANAYQPSQADAAANSASWMGKSSGPFARLRKVG